MPTLVVENIPGEIYERIQRQAQAENRTVSEEAVRLLRQGLSGPEPKPIGYVIAVEPRLPNLILDTGEISPPCDLPRPGVGVQVPVRFGGERLPEPFISEEDGEVNNV